MHWEEEGAGDGRPQGKESKSQEEVGGEEEGGNVWQQKRFQDLKLGRGGSP